MSRHQLESYPSEGGISKRCSRKQAEDDGEVKCSGKSCHSCTGRVIADCVAVCCCPCAVVNLFTLTFVKLPWMMGRKLCLGNKNKKKKLKKGANDDDVISRKEQEENAAGIVTAAIDEEEEEGIRRARFEAERVWLELYKVDNLGFGRVSFNGIQSLELVTSS